MSGEDLQRVIGHLTATVESLQSDLRDLKGNQLWINRAILMAIVAAVMKFALSGGLNVPL